MTALRVARLSIGGIGAAALLVPQAVHACGMCTFAALWQVFPPIVSWSWIAVAWYVALSVVARAGDARIRYVTGPVLAVILAVLGILAAVMVIGPFTMLPFGIAAAAGWLALLTGRSPDTTTKVTRAANWVSGLALVACLFAAGLAYREAARMTDGDIVLKWEGLALGRSTLARLGKRAAQPDAGDAERAVLARELRKIVDGSKSYGAAEAAGILAGLGVPETDVPRLIDALARAEQTMEYCPTTRFNGALRRLSGLGLPDNTTAGLWRVRWNSVVETSATLARR